MDFKQVAAVIWRQRIVVALVLFIGVIVFGFALTKSRKYAATSTILVVSSQVKDAAVLDPSKDPTESAIALADIPSLLSSSTLVAQVGRELNLSKAQTQILGSSIKAKPSLGSDVLPVSVTDADPIRAVSEVNAIVRELQKYEQQIAESRYDLFIEDLQRQLGDRRTALAEIDQNIDALTTRDPYVTYEAGTAAISTRLVALYAQRDQLKATVLGDASTSDLMTKRPDLTRDLASQEIIANDPLFDTLHEQYGKDLAELHKEQAGYTDKFPGLAGLSEEVGREGQSLADTQALATANSAKSKSYVAAQLDENKAEATLAGDQAQLSAVDSEISAMESHLTSSRIENSSLASLRRDREAGNQAYAQLAERLAVAEGDRAQAASINTIVLLDSAVAAFPTLLSRPSLLAASVSVIFLWIAITLALIVDGADSRIRTRTTVEELYGSPVFATVG
jgi:capsular polysaccharide biosynthesis protein